MAKRSIADDLFYLPWWVSIVLAIIVYVVGSFVLTVIIFENPIFIAFSGAAKALTLPVSIALVCIGGFSLLRSYLAKRRRNKLFEKQTGIETIRNLSWLDFERLIGEYFNRHGYTVTENEKKGADDGVDLHLVKDGKRIIVQCKHWKGKVGVPVIREHLGAITAMNADAGFIVSSGEFTRSAKSFADSNSIGLVDGSELSAFFQAQSGASDESSSITESFISNDEPACPKCGASMKLRTARKGLNAGKKFYGCSTFPRCRGIRNL